MSNLLKLHEENIIRELLLQHKPSLLPILNSIGKEALTVEQRESLREVILDEFLQTGTEEDDEPNERGLMLEQLIDKLGHL